MMVIARVAGAPAVDNLVLNVAQQGIPLVPRPYAAAGALAGCNEEDVIDCLERAKAGGVLRQLSAIWDTRTLGYQSTLVAARVSEARLDAAAQVINSHPGVSHNYRRDHEFNLWFTLAVPGQSDLQWSAERLGWLAGASAIRLFPTERVFKIGVSLDMTGERDLTSRAEPAYNDHKRQGGRPAPLTTLDREIVSVTQDDLPLVQAPFEALAGKLGISEAELLGRLRELQESGHLRRFAAILRHRKAGFGANVMTVWAVPPDRVSEVGELIASYEVVTHCYQRRVHEDWPYNLFAMVHARTFDDCDLVVNDIQCATGVTERALLTSSTEYKKVRIRYFSPDLETWESAQRALAESGR